MSNFEPRVFVERFEDKLHLKRVIADALEWTGAENSITSNTRIFIKPNLTWRIPTPGVTVTPLFLRALIENLRVLTPHITVGESEGGQACFQAEDSFHAHGLYDLQREFGIQVKNLSQSPHEVVTTLVQNRSVAVLLPSLLLHEVDFFITLPVPKIHAMTGVSLGFKNQWGCLGDKMRVNQHPHFDNMIVAINKLLKPKFCIFDGTYFLDKTGPMIGEPVEMNLVLAGTDIGATSLACCEIMRVDPFSISHHRVARDENMFPRSVKEIVFSRPIEAFPSRQFQLKRAYINYIHLAAFKSVFLNRMFYDSRFANGLHEFLWRVRRIPVVRRALYGKFGPGEANRGGRAV
jgi:uncharacterized protein (DUF362 family)